MGIILTYVSTILSRDNTDDFNIDDVDESPVVVYRSIIDKGETEKSVKFL